MQNLLISTDTLTSLNNRNQLERYLQSPRDSKSYYVVMVDVDHFKQINDTYGHIEGDRALVLVSKALKSACACMGKSVFLCRYGGDEFLLVVQTEIPEYVIRIIRECLREEIENRDERRYYTLQVSIGYASWDGRVSNFRKSVIDADQMMYEDKRST
ncbi:GGDEF domain-containing protein [Fibrobacter sp. UWB1]|nr:GGDEF domain-containing protein [Fibrobacter sp. UWB1]